MFTPSCARMPITPPDGVLSTSSFARQKVEARVKADSNGFDDSVVFNGEFNEHGLVPIIAGD